MKSMVIGGIILIVALMAGTYFVAGDAFVSGDYINMLTMIAAFAIITISVFVVLKYVNQMKNDTASGELAEENWDGIGEYRNEIPTGWGLAFIGTMIWLIWYWTAGYPTNAFSQIGQWNEEVIEYNGKFSETFKNPSHDTLKAMGESVFLVQCAPCHGIDGEGIAGKAQNLVNWGKEDYIAHVVLNGVKGIGLAPEDQFMGGAGMPAQAQVNPEQAKAIAAYVVEKLAGGKAKNSALIAEGETLFAGVGGCTACHGVDGKGLPGTAPSLADTVTDVLQKGKKGEIGIMPSFKGRLNETQEKALSTYIKSLGA